MHYSCTYIETSALQITELYLCVQTGQCGIPPLLMQRYADELKFDLPSVCLVMEQVRIHTLTSLKRPVVRKELQWLHFKML